MVNSGSSANLVMVGALKKVLSWVDGDEIIVSLQLGFLLLLLLFASMDLSQYL